MRFFLFALSLICFFPSLDAQVISIADARSQPLGATVTVRGIITSGGEFGNVRYMQDGTAGVAIFPGSGSVPGFEDSVFPGDSVEITGPLINFQGLLEISPVQAFSVISKNHPLPTPRLIAIAGINESLESMLVTVECVAFENPGGTFAGSGTYNIVDADGSPSVIYLRFSNPLIGSAIPQSAVRLTGILSQFNDYQILPRSAADIVETPCFYFRKVPDQSNLSATGFTVSWETNLTADCVLFYGDTADPGTAISVPGNATANSAPINNLLPGRIYWVRVRAIHNTDTLYSAAIPFATVSASSGKTEVYFSHPIDQSTAGNVVAAGQSYQEILQAIFDRVDAAKQTLDVCLYNNNRIDLTNKLKAAHNRGVRVRYIAAAETQSTALQPPPAFPVLYGNDFALMHNKFLVIDADDAENAWIMGGSMNWTTANVTNDFNNVVFIQDQSLARAYTLEFEEMWGGSGAQPDPEKARFGTAKRDNTPHRFLVAGSPVELWFSPSDGTNQRIREALESADHNISFALLTFTRDDLGQTVAEAFLDGISVQGMIENTGDQSSEFPFLSNIGVPVYKHVPDGSLHHKYGVVDAYHPDSDPVVITGSHNWTNAAENSNDENTLILHNADLAILFQAECNRRLAEVLTGIPETGVARDWIAFPNPATDRIRIQRKDQGAITGPVELWTAGGRLLGQWRTGGEAVVQIDLAPFPIGNYIIRVTHGENTVHIPVQKVQR